LKIFSYSCEIVMKQQLSAVTLLVNIYTHTHIYILLMPALHCYQRNSVDGFHADHFILLVYRKKD
ncbi:hypothetical protein T12_11041, partial [Trichinella patagoniensis]